MFPVKKLPKSESYETVDKVRADRNAVKGFKSMLKRAEEGKILMDESFITELKMKIKELE